MSDTNLFTPLTVGGMALSHRVVMAPLTRMRATVPDHAANDMMADYYGQRASEGGLIIAEASQISEDGRGAPCTPGTHSASQVAGELDTGVEQAETAHRANHLVSQVLGAGAPICRAAESGCER